MRKLDTLIHPARYQGAGRRYPYFEGWYFKLVDASEQHRYAVIPGIYLGPTPDASHCFVQFMDGMSGDVSYFRYPVDAFVAAEDRFEVCVGPNRFQAEALSLALEGPDRTVQGKLRFSERRRWPVTWLSPGAMGWYAWVPFMECYHGIVSMDHNIQGLLQVDGARVNMTGGRGYTEKDWGRRFPAAWVWFQSNHFDPERVSISASVALIPWLGRTFRGFIIGVWHAGTLHRFATYTGARIERLTVDEELVRLVVADGQRRMELEIDRDEPGQLYAPDIDDMSGRVGETMHATARLRLTSRDVQRSSSHAILYEGAARMGSLEVVGDMSLLTTD